MQNQVDGNQNQPESTGLPKIGEKNTSTLPTHSQDFPASTISPENKAFSSRLQREADICAAMCGYNPR